MKTMAMESGKVVIASITSCTNTSNPYVMIGAGSGGAKAHELGLNRKPWVKTSLAPGSQVVSAYLEAAGLQDDLDAIGFNLVGYGCTTCIGNSGPIQTGNLGSHRRGRPGRHLGPVGQPQLRRPDFSPMCARTTSPRRRWSWPMRWQARLDIDLTTEPIGQDKDGNDVFLKDIWPTQQEIAELVQQTVTREAFPEKYADVFKGDEKWQSVVVPRNRKPMTGLQRRPTSRTRPISWA